MLLGDFNLLFFSILILFMSFIINNNTALSLLLSAELIWIFLYNIVLIIGFVFDNLNLLSLTFFFLIFSAVEFSIGLILLFLQYLLLRTISINFLDKNNVKYDIFFKNKLFLNKIKWFF